jgi:hypothetical protein
MAAHTRGARFGVGGEFAVPEKAFMPLEPEPGQPRCAYGQVTYCAAFDKF